MRVCGGAAASFAEVGQQLGGALRMRRPDRASARGFVAAVGVGVVAVELRLPDQVGSYDEGVEGEEEVAEVEPERRPFSGSERRRDPWSNESDAAADEEEHGEERLRALCCRWSNEWTRGSFQPSFELRNGTSGWREQTQPHLIGRQRVVVVATAAAAAVAGGGEERRRPAIATRVARTRRINLARRASAIAARRRRRRGGSVPAAVGG